jgi:hypothetical protein
LNVQISPVGTYLREWRHRRRLSQLDFALQAEISQRHTRFSWAAGGMPEAPLYLGGTDFIRTGPDGLSTAIVGFVDATPAI